MVGAEAGPIRRRVTLEPAGEGRFGGWAFPRRWEHLGLVEENGGKKGLDRG